MFLGFIVGFLHFFQMGYLFILMLYVFFHRWEVEISRVRAVKRALVPHDDAIGREHKIDIKTIQAKEPQTHEMWGVAGVEFIEENMNELESMNRTEN
jgi:hypothetical protein